MPNGPCPGLAETGELAAWYRRERAAWEAGPRPAEVRRRLTRAWQALAVAADAAGDLRPVDLELASLPRAAAGELVAAVDRTAAAFAAAVEDLDERGAGKGGRRRLAALYQPPPRFRLAVHVAGLLEAAGSPLGSAERGPLHDATLAVLHQADEDGRGLPDVLADVLRARRANRPDEASVCPCPADPPRAMVPA